MLQEDPLGYYDVLNLPPGADQEEIELAYEFLKQAYRQRRGALNIGKIQAAYDTLSNEGHRYQYDHNAVYSSPADRVRRIGKPGVLAILLVMFIGVLGFVFGPAIKVRMTSFSPGDELFWAESGDRFGTVLSYDAKHRFFNGAQSPAYLIEVSPKGETAWYPARDLARLCQ